MTHRRPSFGGSMEPPDSVVTATPEPLPPVPKRIVTKKHAATRHKAGQAIAAPIWDPDSPLEP